MSHGNKMLIHFFSDGGIVSKGFQGIVTRSSAGCGGHFTAPESDILTSSYPSNYNANDVCEWLIEIDDTHLVSLEFYEFSLPQSENCTNGFVELYDGSSSVKPLLAKLCGEKPANPVFNATGNVMLVRFQGDGINVGKGFRAHYKGGCGRRLIADSGGEITTPNYPHTPITNANCNWIITASDPGEKVTLLFTSFLSHFGCTSDTKFLEIRDGDRVDSPLIGNYCGTEAPPPITSQGNALHLRTSFFGIFRAVYGITSSHCGATLTALSGSFASPGFPNNYPMGSECIWIIEASLGNGVQLQFRSFDLVESPYCNSDYVEIHENDAAGPSIGRYCNNEILSHIFTSNKLWIKFRSDDQSTGAGFQADYNLVHGNELNGTGGIIESPGYPIGGVTHGYVQWLITVPEDRVISLEFLDMDIQQGRANCWTAVKFYDGSETTSADLGEFCGYTVPPPVVSHGNQVLIVYESYYHVHSKWRLKWAAVEESTIVIEPPSNSSCWQELILNSTEPVEFTSPDYPAQFTGTNCTWIIRSSAHEHIVLNFTDVPISGYPPHCGLDRIEVYIDPEPFVENWVLNTTICSQTNISVVSSTNLMKVILSADRYRYYNGFRAIVKPACGGFFYETSGHISSSEILAYVSQAQALLSNFMCEWTIQVRQKRTIQITFDDFDFPSDNVCSNAYIMLFNGASSTSPMLGNGRFCGTSKPSVPETSSNVAHIRLMLSFWRGSRSPTFVLRYREVSVACGGQLFINQETKTVSIQSPNFPNPPPHPMECKWVIMSPSGTRLRIDFDSNFHMGRECYWYGTESQVEFVALYDGGTENAQSIAKSCGTNHPESRLTTGNTLYVSYFTNVDHPGGGFKATIETAICGGIKTGYYGVISSPNHPLNYSSSLECEWIIKPPSNYIVVLRLIGIDTPPSTNCSLTDYIEIREDDKNGALKGRFCGNSIDDANSNLDISSDIVYVKFKSDSARTGTGFALQYYVRGASCGGYYQTPTGEITSPNYPLAVPITHYCYWTIFVPEGRMATLTFSALNFPRDPNTNECVHSLKVYTYRQVHQTLCGSDIPEPIHLSSRYVRLQMIGSTLAAGEGFVLTYTTDRESSCGGLLPPPSGIVSYRSNTSVISNTSVDCTWKIVTEAENVTTVLRFTSLDIPGNTSNYCVDSDLYFHSIGQGQLGSFCGNMTNTQPVVTSPYQKTFMVLRIYPVQPTNVLYATYNMSECGGLITDMDSEITSPGYPSNYPPNTVCHWVIRHSSYGRIQATILDLELDSNCKDYISIYDGPSKFYPLLLHTCGSVIPAPITATYSVLSIIFQSDAYGSARGFKLTTAEVETGCGGLIQGGRRNITSPNYPSRYDNNVECVWTIEFRPGLLVNITFVDRFDLEMSSDCNNDFILIEDYQENSWQVRAKKCGHEIPPTFISWGTKMRLTFHSNGNIQGDGFKIMLSLACGGHFSSQYGSIMSPNFPMNYEDNLHCKYLIGQPEHYTDLKFDSSSFSIEAESNCSYDYINIYRGNTTSSTLEGKYCGDSAPPPLTVFGQILVEFVSDFYYTASGFQAYYSVIECGGVHSDLVGFISTRTMSGQYLNNMRCTWIIQVPENYIIALRFMSFDVEGSYRCYYDYVDVFDGNITSSDGLVGKLCGKTIPPIVKSSSNVMTVHWHTDYSVTRKGFTAFYYYTRSCGEIKNTTSGQFASLDYDNDGKYEPNLDCIWQIIVEEDFVIEFSFTQFELESATNGSCRNDFLEIRDGLTIFDPVIQRYCGNSIPLRFRTSSNKASVVFHTNGNNNMAGFQASYTSVPSVCGNSTIEANNTSETLTSPSYPSSFPSNIYCRWKFLHRRSPLSVTFNDMDLPCSEGYVEVHSLHMLSNPHRFCGPTHPHQFAARSTLLVNFFSKTNSAASRGFSLSYQTVGCNANYTSEYGTIVSVDYPYYSYYNACDIYIETTPGRTISLYFQRFYANSLKDCSTGNITIYDGSSSSASSLGTLCGNELPDPIFSTGHSLLFRTVLAYQPFMYFASFTSSDKGRGCGGTLSYTNGTFTSPFYPSAYNQSNECLWLISVPGHHTLTLTFESLALSSAFGCTTNYIEIFEGHSDALEQNRAGRFCGTDFPAPYSSRGNQVLVKLVTNATNIGSGFNAHFHMNPIDMNVSPIFVMAQDETPLFNGINTYIDW